MSWDYTSAVNVLLGGVLGGASAIVAQSFSAKKQLELQQKHLEATERLQREQNDATARLQQEQNERIDAGVRGQVVAMLADLCQYVQVGWNFGFVDLDKFRPSLERILNRVEAPDVAIAFADESIRSLIYEVAFQTKLSFDFIVQNEPSWTEGNGSQNSLEERQRDHMNSVFKGSLNRPFYLFLSLWDTLGIQRYSQAMREVEKERTNRDRVRYGREGQ